MENNRRDFLRSVSSLSLVAATTGTWPLGAAEQTVPFRLNYLLASPMYGTAPLAELLEEVAKTGSDSIDIWPRRHANHREQVEELGHERFLQLLSQRNVRLAMITRFDLGPYALQDEMRVLRKLGGRILVTGAGKGQGDSLRQRVVSFVESMKPHLETAAGLGVTIAIENHANSLIDSPDSLRYFADAALDPHLGIALAPYHLPQDLELLAGLIRNLGRKLVHFYAWQHGAGCMTAQPKEQELLQMPGRGSLDFVPLLSALQNIGYSGWTEIFMHPFPRGIPILHTTAAVTEEINAARKYLDGCVRRLNT